MEMQQVVVVIRRHPSEGDEKFQERVDELVGLCEAAGGAVVRQVVQTRNAVDAALYIGSGKVEEVRMAIEAKDADVVVFDAELSPGQVRNLEHRLPCRVIDRTQLILDIFAQRARSREGMLQVEIAQLQYLLPRLTGRGAELSRLGGGIGTRGPGESKLEMDRRRIRERISHLRDRLKGLEGRRTVQRNRRSRSTPAVALVGYTNAGKTTLLRRWTEDRGSMPIAPGHNRLFDTLDLLARRVKSGATGEIVVLDTVGFVQNLPHLLVDAFRATLEEATAVDLIVHVVDATSTSHDKMETTYQVLKQLDALKTPVITLFNKADLLEPGVSPPPDMHASASIYASAETGLNMEAFYRMVDDHLGMDAVRLMVETDPAEPTSVDGLWSRLARLGRIVNVQSEDQSSADGLGAEWSVQATDTLPLGGDKSHRLADEQNQAYGQNPTDGQSASGLTITLEVERRVAERTRHQLLNLYPNLHIQIQTGRDGAVVESNDVHAEQDGGYAEHDNQPVLESDQGISYSSFHEEGADYDRPQ